MIDFYNYMNFLVKMNISANQFIMLYFIYSVELGEGKLYSQLIIDYASAFGVKIPGEKHKRLCNLEQKQQLIDRGLMIRVNEKDTAKSYKVTEKFSKYFISMYQASQEVFAAYPGYGIVKGARVPLKTSKIASREEIRVMYMKAINGNRSEHEEVLKDIEYGRDNGWINMNIGNFIQYQLWNDIRRERKKHTNDDKTQTDFF